MPDVTSHLRDAGFGDDEISSWATSTRQNLKGAGFNDGEIDDYFGTPKTPATVPQALIDRFVGPSSLASVERKIGAMGEGFKEGFGEAPPGPSKENTKFLQDIGLFPKDGVTPMRFQVAAQALARGGDALMRAFGGVAGSLAGLVGQSTLEEGGSTGEAARQKRDVFQALNITALLMGTAEPMARVTRDPMGKMETQTIGGLPRGEDFSSAARVVGNGDAAPAVEQKLADLYQEKGLHPAEVAHDAQHDVTITQSLLSSDKEDMPAAYGVTAFHGSPHDFDAFSTDKIGTGEGDNSEGWGFYFSSNKQSAAEYRKAGTNLEQEPPGDGHLYQAKIHVDPDHFLNWEKPLAQQSDHVKDALRPFLDSVIGDGDKASLSGEQLYDRLTESFGNAETASRALGAHGVPGIQYAEQGSKGEAIPNYVVFDRSNVEITHKNGTPVSAAESDDILTEKMPASVGAAAKQMPGYTDAEKQILSKISVDEKAPEAKLTWDKLYTNVIDKLFPIGKAVKEADLPDLKAEDNPYNLARLLSGHVGKADHFLNNATFDFKTYEANGPSLKEILGPVKNDLNGFRAYATAARALELEYRGVRSGFDEGGATAPPLVSSGIDAARTVVAQGRDRFEKPFRALVDYQNRVSQYLRDSGVLSDAGYKAMVEANKMYVPFSRVMGLDEGAPVRGGSTLQAHNPIKAIKGSARDIVDPIESVVRNTYHLVEMAEKNVVGTKLVDMLQRASAELPEAPAAVKAAANADLPRAGAIGDALGEVGIKKPDDLADALAHASAPTRDGEIAVLRDGKRETYQVDPELARAMKGLDSQSMGLLEKILSYPASTLRAGAVTTPDFALRHTFRDFLYAATTFKGGAFTPLDMARGFSGLIMKDADYWDWLKGGGGNISMVGLDRQYLQENLRELTGKTGLVGRAWNVLADPEASMWQKTGAVAGLPFQAISKFALDPLRAVTQFAENASHLGAFKKSMRGLEAAGGDDLRSQIIQSAWTSRDTAVDAARMGANMRAYNLITAFANIKLQDTDRVVRAIKDDPLGTITKIGAAITAPSVALWLANHDDPRYAEIPQWEKDMFWLVMTKDHVFRVPKPWAMGMVFGSAPERLLDAFAAGKPDSFKGYAKQLWETSGPDFIPTAAAPIIDQFANRSTFTNRTLIPAEQEKFLPEYQYTPYTTEAAKALGKIVGAFPGMTQLKMDNSGWGGTARALTSPILIENYIRGWSGNLGVYALQTADLALRKAGVVPDPPQPASTLADIPVIRAFVVRYPSASAESIQSFYDAYAANKAYFDTWRAMAADGNVAAMQHIQAMGGPMMFAQLDGIKSVLTEHNQIIRDIYKNPDMAPAEKRQLIDQLYFSMIQVARHGNEAVAGMRKQSQEMQQPSLTLPLAH